MIPKNYKNYKQVLVCGDIHGAFDTLRYLINTQYLISNSVIFVAGDIGVGFARLGYYLDKFKKIDKELSSENNYVYFIRGNHDDPNYFTGDILKTLNENLSNIQLVKDYEIISTIIGNILCIGGAISIDRTLRTVGIDYWENEGITENISLIKKMRNIDHVITHSAPSFADPISKSDIMSWLERDPELKELLEKERNYLSTVYNILKNNNNKIQTWSYGHFHKSYTSFIDNTKFICCNIQEIKSLKPLNK